MSATRPRMPSGVSLCPGGRRRLLALIHRLLIGPACSTLAWLLRERESTSAMHGFLRRGGGLFAIATLSLLAGWLLPDIATLRAHLGDAPGGCFRIAWVPRITTGVPEEPGPILLIQTAWTRDVPESGAHDEDACRASEVLLALPPLKDSISATLDGVFVPLVKPGDRPMPRLPVPPELCQRPSARSSSQGTREPRPLVSPRTQHRPA